jgi:hypothetical protein
VVSTGGRFVASTLDICNDAFIKGGDALTLSGTSDASVINLGRISSSGGDVFLIARQAVINAGTVKAPSGTVELAAGESVLLQDSTGSKQVFVQTGSQGTIVNAGSIKAAQISLQAADGNVYALAGGGARMRATGTATRDGHVWLVAASGQVLQGGTVTAKNADGSGGTVDTQATSLAFGPHTAVLAGLWNIKTPTFTIDSAIARTLQRSLNWGTSIDLETTGGSGQTGDLSVASSLQWRGAASLTVAAYRNLMIGTGGTLKNSGSGNLTLRADALGIDNGGSVTNLGTIDWSGSTGIVSALHDMNGSYVPGTILANPAWVAPQDSGLVTQVTSYALVNSPGDLNAIQSNLAGNYALGKDVDLTSGPGSFNSGLGDYPFAPYSGQFDGMGHTISNLRLSESSGLFAYLGPTGVVRNLTVEGSVSTTQFGSFSGILAGYNEGTITSSHTAGVITATNASGTGGLAGFNGGTITRSSSTAQVISDGTVGGLVGTNGFGPNNAPGEIRQSFASGDVVATRNQGGGLIGYNFGDITQSYATGSVHAAPNCVSNNECAGGLAGWNSGTISQSFATGRIDQPAGQAGGPGGIVDVNADYGIPPHAIITNDVYWDTQTTGAPVGVRTTFRGASPGGAQGLSTAQMSTPSSFGPTYDFGPNGVWAMPVGATHPILRWQLAK